MKNQNKKFKHVINCPELKNAYKSLRLNKKATLLDVKKAYRKFVFKYHPDRCENRSKSWCKDKFIEIKNSRNILESYLTGNYNPVYNDLSEQVKKEKTNLYKDHIDHIKRFYDGWFGGLDF